MKRFVAILLSVVVSCTLSSCGVKKGDGSKFYGEFSELKKIGAHFVVIIHSNMNCSAIEEGTFKHNTRKIDKEFNTYCSKCMNDKLVSIYHNEYLK